MLSALGFKGSIVTWCEKYSIAASPAHLRPLSLLSPAALAHGSSLRKLWAYSWHCLFVFLLLPLPGRFFFLIWVLQVQDEMLRLHKEPPWPLWVQLVTKKFSIQSPHFNDLPRVYLSLFDIYLVWLLYLLLFACLGQQSVDSREMR